MLPMEFISPSYQPRIKLIGSKINEYLELLTPPQNVADEGKIIKAIAEALNRDFPSDVELNVMSVQLDEIIQIMFATWKGKTWPQPAHFLEANKERKRRSAVHTNGLSKQSEEWAWSICLENFDNDGPLTGFAQRSDFGVRLLKLGRNPVDVYKKFDLPISVRAEIELTPEYQQWDHEIRQRNHAIHKQGEVETYGPEEYGKYKHRE